MDPRHAHRSEDRGKIPGKRADELQFLISYDSDEMGYKGQLMSAPGTFAKGKTADACIEAILEKAKSRPSSSTDGQQGNVTDGKGNAQLLTNDLRDNLAAVGMILDLLKMKLGRAGEVAEFVRDVEAARAAVDRTRDGIQQLAGMRKQG